MFNTTKVQSNNVIITTRQIIQIEEIDIMSIPLADGNNIELYNITLVLRYNSNLIFFKQFRKNKIMNYDNLIAIVLMKNKKVITRIKKDQNIFIFDYV